MHRVEWDGSKWTRSFPMHRLVSKLIPLWICALCKVHLCVNVGYIVERRMHLYYYLMSASKSDFHGNMLCVHAYCLLVHAWVWGVNLCYFDSCSPFIISNNMRTRVVSINKLETRSPYYNLRYSWAYSPRLIVLRWSWWNACRSTNAFQQLIDEITWIHFSKLIIAFSCWRMVLTEVVNRYFHCSPVQCYPFSSQ